MMSIDVPPDQFITVVATYTTDHMTLPGGRVAAIPGGPAHYIGDALARLNQRFHVVTGEATQVTVVSTVGGEAYVIPALPPIEMPSPLPGEAVILSPISREILPGEVPPVRGLLAIDLQGFVRLPNVATNVLDQDVDLRDLLQRAAVVKAAPDELAALDRASRNQLQKKIVLETRGPAGMVLHDRGEQYVFGSTPLTLQHTIGAGDTLLAAFVVALLAQKSPQDAAQYGLSFTARTLQARTLQ